MLRDLTASWKRNNSQLLHQIGEILFLWRNNEVMHNHMGHVCPRNRFMKVLIWHWWPEDVGE
jgi:hypothetical protein